LLALRTTTGHEQQRQRNAASHQWTPIAPMFLSETEMP
jgi:hypothetical protein